ncbi:glycosyltransferase family 2 protein [Seonamhaeicola aphaedonensis]|uniref:Glycosyltransferase involved in cell wall biosynthesis n=1 Tax=Seonamhaeicola aphaedonensis TaxID=1461338 RepID=A0A3D9HGI1_9FLAO|nr:glycosyltransferase family A protein [Seonamhaeicola aphaedonensis]RED48371.1 glycosyltransferase involved in cell wall biosynthesis [Seonamhaeicola aphaedonensis]
MNDKSTPLVSICIPTYNGETYIAKALESAIAQTYTNLEIVVSDDASTDNTLQIVATFKEKTAIPIKVYQHTPAGIGANWNHCVKQAQGNYIKFLFQDDVLEPHCIEIMMDLALKNPKVGLVYCKRSFLYNHLTSKIQEFVAYYGNLHTYWQDIKVEQGVLHGKSYLKDRQFLNSPKNKIGEPTAVLLKRACFDKVGYFNKALKQTLDCEFWYRVMKYYDMGFVNEALVKFRLHDAQASAINKQRPIPDKALLYKQYYKHLFWYLHPKNQLKLLKLYHPVFKGLVSLKQKWHAQK